jgi:hypothetical protein
MRKQVTSFEMNEQVAKTAYEQETATKKFAIRSRIESNFGSFLGCSGEWRQLGWAWPDGEMVDSLIMDRIDAARLTLGSISSEKTFT